MKTNKSLIQLKIYILDPKGKINDVVANNQMFNFYLAKLYTILIQGIP